MKKVFKYLQDQALEASNQKYSGASYLSPRGKEPQQRVRHHSPSQYKDEHNTHHQGRSEHPSSAAHSFPAHTAAGTTMPKSTASPRISDEIQRGITRHQYAQDNILQSYEVYIPEGDDKTLVDSKTHEYWILYIHGGYFRDPAVTSSSFYPALELLASKKHHQLHRHVFTNGHHSSQSADIKPYIGGYASINYRLSPHPDKAPQDPQKTPTYELRNAKWPDHILDTLTAIAHLQKKYGFGERYVLVGHSVGATMAFLSTLAPQKAPFSGLKGIEMPKIELPMVILGVSGIYDFPLLHESFPEYIAMTRNAIHNEADDALASPARYAVKDYVDIWTAGGTRRRALVIAHSRDDGWVDWKQVDAMKNVFAGETGVDVSVIEMKGQHNAIWEKGTELARVIVQAVGVMRGLEQ
ncbi:Kynurenine formamidase [Cladophialophora chaetospira]|uniref:Kynurenine formamidase n=1 Tax=Cladophialophora chaetospira TaxID=386627 RepID=A0AA39CQ07_9EURO|nr:Kynurenine formamidase [Cladophialophora chaetospira]